MIVGLHFSQKLFQLVSMIAHVMVRIHSATTGLQEAIKKRHWSQIPSQNEILFRKCWRHLYIQHKCRSTSNTFYIYIYMYIHMHIGGVFLLGVGVELRNFSYNLYSSTFSHYCLLSRLAMTTTLTSIMAFYDYWIIANETSTLIITLWKVRASFFYKHCAESFFTYFCWETGQEN